jgi:hypothetical protein
MYDLAVRYIELEKLAEKLQKDVERLTKELKVRKDVCNPPPAPPAAYNSF